VKDDEFYAEVQASMRDGNVVVDPERYAAFRDSFVLDQYSSTYSTDYWHGPGLKPVTRSDFTEIWKFVRHEDGAWVLDWITQREYYAAPGESFSESVAV
jgi:hypothetical protein